MSLRIMFSRPTRSADLHTWDGPEKTKSRAKSMFKMSPDVTVPLQTKGNVIIGVNEQQYAAAEYDEEDDGVIELDIRCLIQWISLLFVLTLFGVGIFACGATFAGSDTTSVMESLHQNTANTAAAEFIKPNVEHVNEHEQPREQPPDQVQSIMYPSRDSLNSSSNALGTHDKTIIRRAPVEYIELGFYHPNGVNSAIATIDQCLRLVIQQTQYKVIELLFEQNRMLLRPDQASGQSDVLLELLGQQTTIVKLQGCAGVVIAREPVFVYR